MRDTYVRRAFIYRVYDGDTVWFHADLGYGQYAVRQCGRLLGVNTPELKGSDKDLGILSRNFLADKIVTYCPYVEGLGYECDIRSEKTDSFGRWLIDLWFSEANASDLIILAGMGEIYGGPKTWASHPRQFVPTYDILPLIGARK